MFILFLLIMNFQVIIPDYLKSLVNAELSFAKLSESKGIKEAFVTYLSDNAIVFRPFPIPGKKIYEESDHIPGILKWSPSYADISSSGEIGFTTGPFTFFKDSVTSYGHFVSIWGKNENGLWNVWLDVGISHESYQTDFGKIDFAEKRYNSKGDNKENLVQLDTIESNLSKKDYINLFEQKSRLFRNGFFPIIGLSEVKKYIDNNFSGFRLKPEFYHISDAGDLGFTYGTGEYKTPNNLNGKFGYLRIWKRNDNGIWKIALELFNN